LPGGSTYRKTLLYPATVPCTRAPPRTRRASAGSTFPCSRKAPPPCRQGSLIKTDLDIETLFTNKLVAEL